MDDRSSIEGPGDEARPLAGLLVIDMSQFLAGPLAALRLGDLGARVIKVERPGSGDLGRNVYLNEPRPGRDNLLFQAINRNKESFAADLKEPADRARVQALCGVADVVIQNFRPGVSSRLSLGYDTLRERNPRLVFGEVTGYGEAGPWRERPGQDLLAQARSGIMWLNGDAGDPPAPMGLAVADMLAAHTLVQGLLACLIRRGVTGRGGKVETSLIEALLDLQFEVLTVHLNDGRALPKRAATGNAHAYLGAPYGIYATADGYLAIAMTPLDQLGRLIGIAELTQLDESAPFTRRDEIKGMIAERIRTEPTAHWLSVLEREDVWCSEVLDWHALMASPGFAALDPLQVTVTARGERIETTRCPLRIDGVAYRSPRAAPTVGEHTRALVEEFRL